jgi:hypothetical protein
MSNTPEKLAELLAARLLDIMQNGQEQINQVTGERERVQPSATMLKVVMAYVKDAGVTNASRETQRAAARKFLDQLKAQAGTDRDMLKLISDIDDDESLPITGTD